MCCWNFKITVFGWQINRQKCGVIGWQRRWKWGLNSHTYAAPKKWECPYRKPLLISDNRKKKKQNRTSKQTNTQTNKQKAKKKKKKKNLQPKASVSTEWTDNVRTSKIRIFRSLHWQEFRSVRKEIRGLSSKCELGIKIPY